MKTEPLSPRDPSSYSRPEISLVRHVDLDFKVNFAERTLDCAASLHFDILQDTDHLILDASELAIESVHDEGKTSELKYSMTEHLISYGSKMTVHLPTTLKPGNKTSIHVKYKTSPTATALQWLEPAQTFGKKVPFLFSQCQPIHARSIVPIQDSPAVKFTYEARVTAGAQFTALMSARRGTVEPAPAPAADSVTAFSQPVPVPAYLLALAVGPLHSRPLGPRTRVWAEEEVVERAAWEFADTERFLRAAEAMCGPYVWGPYELLVLPPSFPYGGMENPCLTFVTPTLLSGDRSQADVIVHEIMHSWSGNLVTNRNFEHFWLNEGFTVFLERKVAASLVEDPAARAKSRDFHSLLGLQDLKDTINGHLGANNSLTKLVVDLKTVHPDDAFSSVPYEKGSLFLRYLEDLVGGPEVFDVFLRAYLEKFARQSIDTEQFRALFLEHFKATPAAGSVDWSAWLHAPGMPPHIPNYDTTMSKVCTELAKRIIAQPSTGISSEDVKDFDTHQMVTVLEELIEKPPLPLDKLAAMRTAYKLQDNKNTEIKFRWLRLCLKARDEAAVQESLDFVNSQGRMKYVRPLYRELYNWTQTRDRAVKNFNEHKGQMMHVSAQTLMKDLHLV